MSAGEQDADDRDPDVGENQPAKSVAVHAGQGEHHRQGQCKADDDRPEGAFFGIERRASPAVEPRQPEDGGAGKPSDNCDLDAPRQYEHCANRNRDATLTRATSSRRAPPRHGRWRPRAAWGTAAARGSRRRPGRRPGSRPAARTPGPVASGSARDSESASRRPPREVAAWTRVARRGAHRKQVIHVPDIAQRRNRNHARRLEPDAVAAARVARRSAVHLGK